MGAVLSKSEEKIWAPCASCSRSTRHEILFQEVILGDDDYNFRRSYGVIRCCGCEAISFRDHEEDFESAYPTGDGEWEVPEETSYYPRRKKFGGTIDLFLVPDIVRAIYAETIIAIDDDALTLASLGLRGTIEAVCNDQKVPGKTLDTRINKLSSLGLISSRDAERLHAIRFLGNDAAHEIKKPKPSQIGVALSIVDHLIRSVYILEMEANGSLETIVTRPDEFKSLLDKHIDTFEVGDEFPLAKFLAKDMRRLGGGASALEVQLMGEISSGTYTRLKVGKLDVYEGSKSPLQHFVVTSS